MHNNKDQKDNPIKPTRFWIIGAGHFGRLAVERITRHISDAIISVVDKQPFTLAREGIVSFNQDGIGWLKDRLSHTSPVDMIVPAIPVHVAYAWLTLKLKNYFDIHSIHIPDSWLIQMPHAIRGTTGQAFVSHADFLCPDNCPEPENICTHTGKPRPMDLFRLLDNLDIEAVLPIVLRSHQLLPGVGGIYPADLMSALDTARKNSQRPLMIATACRCHGVVDFLRLEKKADSVRQW